ncbi:Amino acid oxidase fsqB [Cladobotryum mycophilum]|uniref:Amino acid oxidase fsqB n=1 Tax=Cladobotryum mycophilum TaxID=491253 RepID=A0ABR0SVM1_9HYPO
MACPRSIIIVGSGVFGLSTAYAMANDDAFAQTSIILVDGWDFELSRTEKGTSKSNLRAANYDTSRIIRSEYPHGAYATFAREAHSQWRGKWGENGRYVEQRLLLCAQGSPLRESKKPGETVNYVKNAYSLSCQLSQGSGDNLRIFNSLHQIRAELGVAATSEAEKEESPVSLRGYVSQDSDWADSGATMAWLWQKLLQSGRVQTHTGYVQSLIYTDRDTATGKQPEVRGVRLDNGVELLADLTIVAASSHTPRLLGMETLCDVYSEDLNVPMIVNATRCVFAIAPDREGYLKLGRFSHSGLVDVRQCAGIAVGPRPDSATPREKWNDAQFGWGGDVDLSKDLDERAQGTLREYRAFLKELFSSSDTSAEAKLLGNIAKRPFSKSPAFNTLGPANSNNFRLGDMQRKKLLLRMERDSDVGDHMFYCFLCTKLHGFGHTSFTYPDRLPEQQKCCNRGPEYAHSGVRFAPTGSNLQVGYWQARLVMNRHFYGPGRGLSLETIVPNPEKWESIHRSVKVIQSMEARIVQDSLFLKCTHEVTTNPKMNPTLRSFRRDLSQLDLFICNHKAICQSIRTDLRGDMRIPVIQEFIDTTTFKLGPIILGSCRYCPTSFATTIKDHRNEKPVPLSKHKNWTITVVSYHELGHCRTSRGRPDPIFARFLTDSTKERNRGRQPLGHIEKLWCHGGQG